MPAPRRCRSGSTTPGPPWEPADLAAIDAGSARSRRCSARTRRPGGCGRSRSSIELVMPAAKTVTNVTSATPIISAAAVTAVRPGLAHRVLAREPPGDPAQALQRPPDQRGQRPHESRREAARRRTGPSPRPPPISPAAEPEDSIPPNSPTKTSATPPSAEQHGDDGDQPAPAGARSGSAASRSAAIGVTRVARSAGAIAATSVDPDAHGHERDDRGRAPGTRCRCSAGRCRSP